MPLADQQKRYMKLNGEAIHTRGFRSILSSPALRVPILATAFMSAAAYSDSPEKTVGIALYGLLGTAIGHGMHRLSFNMQLSELFKDKAQLLFIDKKPKDSEVPPTSPDNMNKARDMRSYGLIIGICMASMCLIIRRNEIATFVTDTLATSSKSYQNFSGIAGFWLASASNCINLTRNYNKVVKGDWVISDLPKPMEQDDKVHVPLPQPTQG